MVVKYNVNVLTTKLARRENVSKQDLQLETFLIIRLEKTLTQVYVDAGGI